MLKTISIQQSLGLAVAAVASIAPITAQTRFVVQELPTPAGYALASATQINDQGYVVGFCHAADGQPTATLWKNGTVKVLGRLKNGTYSSATAVNSLGVVVGDGDDGDGRPLGWITSGSTVVNFFSNNGGNTRPIAITDKGVVGGSVVKGFSSNWRAAVWSIDPKDARKSIITELPVLQAGDPTSWYGFAEAFNKVGQGAGNSANNAIGQHAVLWNNDAAHSIVDLGVFGSDWSSLAFGINDLGQVVGESHPPFGSRPVLWHNDPAHTAIELPLLPGDNYGSAYVINNAATVVGSSAYGEPGTWNVTPNRTVIWIEGQVYELQSIVDQLAPGWTIAEVTSINNLGQISGSIFRDGNFKAVVLNPVR